MISIAEAYRREGLIPYSELPDITQRGWCPEPLIIERDLGDGQYLAGLGLAHRSDIGNPHYRALIQTTTRFMGATVAAERILMNEGGPWPLSDTLEEAYKAGGEPQWLQNYGATEGVSVVSPELRRDGASLLLQEGFIPSEIACYLFVRQVPQYERLDPGTRPSFDEYIGRKMRQRAIETGVNFDFGLSNLIGTYETMFNKKFDREDTQFFYQHSAGYMLEPTSRVQEAATICNMGRDVNFIRTTQRYINQGFSVEFGCGWTHIYVMQTGSGV